MYWYGHMIRFQPHHIIDVFQYIFTEGKFKKFKNGNKWKEIQSSIYTPDSEFDDFYRRNKIEKGFTTIRGDLDDNKNDNQPVKV